MSHRDLVDRLEKNNWKLKRRGGNHDIYTNGKDIEAIPRKRKINDMLAQTIIKRHGLV